MFTVGCTLSVLLCGRCWKKQIGLACLQLYSTRMPPPTCLALLSAIVSSVLTLKYKMALEHRTSPPPLEAIIVGDVHGSIEYDVAADGHQPAAVVVDDARVDDTLVGIRFGDDHTTPGVVPPVGLHVVAFQHATVQDDVKLGHGVGDHAVHYEIEVVYDHTPMRHQRIVPGDALRDVYGACGA